MITSMTLEQKIVLFFVFLEVFLVSFFVGAIYVMRLHVYLRENRDRKKEKTLADYFKYYNTTSPLIYATRPDLILKALKSCCQMSSDQKNEFVSTKLLPKMQFYINSKNWIKRYYLLECYRYSITNHDIPDLIRLIDDDIPIVSLNAVQISSVLSDDRVYQAIIHKINTLDHSNQTMYFPQLKRRPQLMGVLKETLSKSQDTALKKLCYDVVTHLGGDRSDFYDLALHDVMHTDRNCQLAAIRVLAHANPKKAKTLLLELLTNENWLIRNTVVKCLGEIGLNDTIAAIAGRLEDENYWVQVNAVNALLKFGEEGLMVLKKHDHLYEKQSQPIATYFQFLKV